MQVAKVTVHYIQSIFLGFPGNQTHNVGIVSTVHYCSNYKNAHQKDSLQGTLKKITLKTGCTGSK